MRYIFILITVFLGACSQSSDPVERELNKLSKAYEIQPSTERATAYLTKATEFISGNKEDIPKVMPVLQKASDIAIDAKMYNQASGYLMAQVRESSDEVQIKQSLKQLGDIMLKLGKSHASNIIHKGIIERYPNDNDIASLNAKLTSEITSTEGYLNFLFDQVLVDPNEYGINRQNALKFVDGTEAFALSLPDHEGTPDFLYKAAEVARSLRTMPKAMALYDWILDKYPNHDKGPTTLFIKGFLLEQEFGQEDEARLVFEKFLQMYPEHEMASSAKFLLNNMGKSDEEILKEIEEKRKANSEIDS